MSPSRTAVPCLLTLLAGCGGHLPANLPKLVVIGVDGMDPGFVERHWDTLPNLRNLRDVGGFRRLKTTTPPQSPVAWSTFITGLDPSGHGIYDFVHRDPSTMALFSSMDRTEAPRFSLPIGPWRLPMSKARVVSLRRGTPFWKLLADQGVPVMTIRMPTNYPPVNAGKALAGMGVPDLRGGFGTFTLFTDDPEEITRTVSGGRIVKISVANGRVILPLEGPPNSLRKDEQISSVSITADIDPASGAARFQLGDWIAIVREREWSDWATAEFPLATRFVTVTGMFRLYAKQLSPRLQIYATPVNVDPRSPALPIAEPAAFSADLAREAGLFYTQGIPEDTSALRQGALSLPEYLEQSRLVLDGERRLLQYSVRHFQSGLLFFYFSHVDQNSHVLWGRHEPELLDSYRAVDVAIGEALRALPDAHFVVMSDHGFARFDRGFQLNAWLVENGFLVLSGPPGGEGFRNVDWGKTRAYGLGLNGLYLNLRGREAKGSVEAQDRAALLERIRTKLLATRDPNMGAAVIQSVAITPESTAAPDLIVGYSPGYRATWDTALGSAAGPVIQENVEAWIGDHCIAPEAVPGVLLSNRPLRTGDPELRDLPLAILRLFGLKSADGRDPF